MNSAVVIEFGSNRINVGISGESLPSRSFDAEAIFTSSSSNSTNQNSSNKKNNKISLRRKPTSQSILLDLDVYGNFFLRGGSGSGNSSDAVATNNNNLTQRKLWSVAAHEQNFSSIGDEEIAAEALRHMLWSEGLYDTACVKNNNTNIINNNFGESNNNSAAENNIQSRPLICVVPDEVLSNDSAFETWTQCIFDAGFKTFFPVRSAVAATVESGRASAIVLDLGHRGARMRVVDSGHQLLKYNSSSSSSNNNNNNNNNSNTIMSDSTSLSGSNLNNLFESVLVNALQRQEEVEKYQQQQQQKENNNMGEDSATSTGIVSSSSSPALTNTILQKSNDNNSNYWGKSLSRYCEPTLVPLTETSTAGDGFSSTTSDCAVSGSPDQKQQNPHSIIRRKIIQEVKQSVGVISHVPLQSENNMNNNNNNNNNVESATFICPDGKEIKLSGYERSFPFESLFSSSFGAGGGFSSQNHHQQQSQNQNQQQGNRNNDTNNLTLQHFICNYLQKIPSELKMSLPFIISGGTCRTQGFQVRLMRELQLVNASFNHIVPKIPQDPFSQWRGASFLSAAPQFQRSWISEKTVQEKGFARVRADLP